MSESDLSKPEGGVQDGTKEKGKGVRFESLIAWQKARELTKAIAVALDVDYRNDRRLTDLRAQTDETSRDAGSLRRSLQPGRPPKE